MRQDGLLVFRRFGLFLCKRERLFDDLYKKALDVVGRGRRKQVKGKFSGVFEIKDAVEQLRVSVWR